MLIGLAAQAQAAPPPASAFGRLPAVVDAEISPNGKHVAILGGASDRRFISVATIDQPGLPMLDLGDVETVDLQWAGDDYVLATVAYWEKTGPRQAYRMERHITVTSKAEAIARFLDTRSTGAYLVGGQPILGVTPTRPVEVSVLELGQIPGGGVVFAIWRIDPATGRGRMVERGDRDTRSWELDLAGEPRVRLDGGRYAVLGRPKGASQWTPIVVREDPKQKIYFLGYSEPEEAVYLLEQGKLVRRPLKGGPSETVHEEAPSLGLVWDEHRNALVGISTGTERPSVQWLDPEIGNVHGVLARAFKDRNVDLMSSSKDRTRFLARVSAPSVPAIWYLYDVPRKEVSPLGEEYPELKDAALGTTRWITYKARDGLDIPAYVTLPPGAPVQGAKLPLVVLPHGGPTARDIFDFDYLAQFLATRGYAVLQPQFRGSWGFGEAFRKAGKEEWGGKMQTDLLDGVAHLAAQGHIHPDRVCIAGISFGGYAALAGAALHPTAYKCAASIAGISDLAQLLLEEGRLYGRESAGMEELREELGASSREKLNASSPAQHADRVQAPVLLVHGDKDTIVRVEQSERMAEALKTAGKPVELVILEDENHYLTRTATRTRTLEALERFLARHLPVN